MPERDNSPLWLAYKAEAARKNADRAEAKAQKLEAQALAAMMEWFPWAYDQWGELLPDDELGKACREDMIARGIIKQQVAT